MAKNNFGKIVNFIAFVGLACVAIVLILQSIFAEGAFLAALRVIGESIAYLITAISAFFFVKSKRNVWWWVAYWVSVVVVLLLVVLRWA